MVAELQRQRVGSSLRIGVWDKMHEDLPEDYVLVTPQVYIDNRHIYDMVWAHVFIIQDADSGGDLEWCWEGRYPQILKERPDIKILSKGLVVRVRLPWNSIESEWLMSSEELSENSDLYIVLDTYVTAVYKGDPNTEARYVSKATLEMDRDSYEIVEIRYLVTWATSKWSEDYLREIRTDPFLGVARTVANKDVRINPAKTHRVIAR